MNTTSIKKTLLYNLIIFDFILLNSSTIKISNFFLEKVKKKIKNKSLVRTSLFDLLKSFKQFIKLFKYIKKYKRQTTIYFWVSSEDTIHFLKYFFKRYKLRCNLKFDFFFPELLNQNHLASSIIINYPLYKSKFFSFLYKKVYLIQSITSSDSLDFSNYKIISDLDDYKKLIFFSLILRSIFKK
jgi:hypothetical protein